MPCNVTAGYIDLATYDEIDKYLYGDPDATNPFVGGIKKSTYFSQVPCKLSCQGHTGLGGENSFLISRAGDYLLQTWLRVVTPAVTLSPANQYGGNGRLRWTRNLMHNLVAECSLTFNDLVGDQFSSYHLDFWSAFTVPASKRYGYNRMIGNLEDLTGPHAPGDAIPACTLNLPLPFFFSRDSSAALPTAALPYNDMKINVKSRDWNELLILEEAGAAPGTDSRTVPTLADLGNVTPTLSEYEGYANYAVVPNAERSVMGGVSRDFLIDQVQQAPVREFDSSTDLTCDLRFFHPIKALFFALRNKTFANERSNYTAASPVLAETGALDFAPSNGGDPILNASLLYENATRLDQMGADYYSLVNPFYNGPVVPIKTGYHMYSYSLDFTSLNPMGSTNYAKLTHVALRVEASADAVAGMAGAGAAGSGADYPQEFELVVTAVSSQLARVSDGVFAYQKLEKAGSTTKKAIEDEAAPGLEDSSSLSQAGDLERDTLK